MRCKFLIFSLLLMICISSVSVYADEKMDIEVDKVNCNINVSGTLGTEFSEQKSNFILYCRG